LSSFSFLSREIDAPFAGLLNKNEEGKFVILIVGWLIFLVQKGAEPMTYDNFLEGIIASLFCIEVLFNPIENSRIPHVHQGPEGKLGFANISDPSNGNRRSSDVMR